MNFYSAHVVITRLHTNTTPSPSLPVGSPIHQPCALYLSPSERPPTQPVHDAQGALDAVLDEHEAPGLLAVAPHLELLRGANGLAAKRRGRLLAAACKG